MSVAVPGAAGTAAFWANLRDGVESIRRLSEAELLAAGESLETLRRPNYVPVAAPLEGFDQFDAEFFGFSPKDAAILDPQHRKFLETAWEAMEQAGHPPGTMDGKVGVYAGCGMGSYFYFNVCSNPDLVDDVGMFLLRHTGNDKDFLATRVSHVFDLKGPSINVQTACSTSLVAVHYAAQALRAGEIDMAVAGGVTIELPQGRGFLYRENEILSPDGHCHAFDHRAQGTVFGSGAGAVALRRLEDALADGDHIWAVLKGSAVNNDGAAKAGYLAPSVEGQSAAVALALDAAGVAASSIGYVECHGTGTYLGDPIEVAALTDAYRQQTDGTQFCGIGSVKTNIGHLDTAAGVAGLVKTALSLHHRALPPSLNFEAPNPAIDFAASPFVVNDHLRDWPAGAVPRRAGVNALGVGGTNAHAILEEAPEPPAPEPSDWPFQPLCLSGRSKAALEANAQALADHLTRHPQQDLADVAFTLKEGRKGFEKRRVLVARNADEAADLLQSNDPSRVFTHDHLGEDAEAVFLFPGGGAQYPNMARDLYETEPVFAEWMDRGLAHLETRIDYDIRAIWLPEPDQVDAAAARLKTPSVQLPLIMIVEYALAQLWQSWGVQPAAMAGHSMGENVAACLAGVMEFEACIDLVLLRGQLFDEVPAGGMLSISAPLERLAALLDEDLDIASLNAPELIAVSGPRAALAGLERRLAEQEIDCQPIAIDIAAHSQMLDPILDRYRAFLQGMELRPPRLPVLSNRTGVELTPEQATDPDYWVEQLRHCVRFADCVATLAERPARVFLEVGPGKALSALARMHPAVGAGQVLSTLRHPEHEIADDLHFLGVVGRLWACGIEADWAHVWGTARRRRVPLPTYAFQRSRYFISPGAGAVAETPALVRRDRIEDWGYVPQWVPRGVDSDLDPETDLDRAPLTWLIFADDGGRAAPVIARLRGAGHRVVELRTGDGFARLGEDRFALAPEQGRVGYDQLLAALREGNLWPDRIGHFWLTADAVAPRPGSSVFDRNMEQGFWSLTWLGQALAETAQADAPLHLVVFTTGAAQHRDEALPYPEKAMISGPAGVLPREVPGLTCATVDLDPRDPAAGAASAARGWRSRSGRGAAVPLEGHEPPDLRLLEELLARPANGVAIHRGPRRFAKGYRPHPLAEAASTDRGFVEGGTYLITGGFGGIGQTLAADLLTRYRANVILLGRQALPERAHWQAHLDCHGGTDPQGRRILALRHLQDLARQHGGTVDAAAGDVANLAQMRRVLGDLQETYGRLNGVIHAAGSLDDGPVLGKSEAAIHAVLAPKVQGLRVLEQLLPDGAIDLLVLCSSSSTAIRAAGQVDYVAANAWLDAYAQARAGGRTRVVAVNWGVWADTGMAAQAVAGEAAPQVQPLAGPMMRSLTRSAGEATFCEASLSTADWVLDQHRTEDGRAILPGTAYVEALAEAAQALALGPRFEIADLYFLRAMPVAEGAARRLRITLDRRDGGYAADLRSDCRFAGQDGWQLHAEARLAPLTGPTPAPIDPAAIAARCGAPLRAGDEGHLPSPQEAHLRFGPRWQVLRETRLAEAEGLAELSLPDALRADLEAGHLLHPGLLDLATGWAMPLIPGYGGAHLWVPVSYGSIRVHAPLPQRILSWARRAASEQSDGFARFDVTLCAPDGTILVEIRDFAMKRLDASFGDTPLDAREVSFADGADEGPANRAERSPAEQRLAFVVSQGIRAAEGPEALRRVLAQDRPQVIVSSLPLEGLMAQADQPAAETAPAGQSFDRPGTDETYVAPRDMIEAALAEIWENLLGVRLVGVEDNFFDLGGHSLIAVRLFAKVKRRFDVDFPISVLFEAPTIAACARLIAAETGGAEAGDLTAPTPAQTQAASTRSHRHLVPLNQCSRKDAAPLFIVAGMFGNVLNLRHLALAFDATRPVYGVQARGLTGDDAPHEKVEDAAADYLAEIRELQPDGPYLLAGYSGGGITAYEMAQQLQQQGEAVAVLALLDTPLPVRPGLTRRDKALIKLTELRRKGPAYLLEWARNRWAWETRHLRQDTSDGAETNNAAFNNSRIEAAFRHAVAQYHPRPWDGPITLFRPPLDRHWKVSRGHWVSAEREYVFDDNEWRRHAPRLEIIEVPGDHVNMVLAPSVTVLAQEMAEVIARAGQGAGAPGWPLSEAAE